MNRSYAARQDRKVARLLFDARRGLRQLLVPESASLVTMLGHVECALEYTVEPDESGSVGYHCRKALRIVEAIERRYNGALPQPIGDCLDQVRSNVDHALRRTHE
jgi:hypothetical protein